MSISVIQKSGAVALSSLSYSFPTLPGAGNSVIIGISLVLSAVGVVTGVTDNQGVGNIYVKLGNETTIGGGGDAEFWWCSSIGNTSGTFTVTATNSGTLSGSNSGMGGMEATGINAIDQTGVAQSNAVNSLSVTASGANTNAFDLVLAGFTSGSTSGTGFGPPSTGYTAWFNTSTSGPSWLTYGYKIVSATETSAATSTWGNSANACGIVVTMKPAVAPTATIAWI
jgi:hypothetical protein